MICLVNKDDLLSEWGQWAFILIRIDLQGNLESRAAFVGFGHSYKFRFVSSEIADLFRLGQWSEWNIPLNVQQGNGLISA